MKARAGVLIVLALLLAAVPAGQGIDRFTVPTFGQVNVYRPAGPPLQVVLFISGDGGWNLGVVSMAERLRDLGALVVGIDIRTFLKSLSSPARCAYPAGALEELSRAIQLRYELPVYERPILVGYSSGATLVYAALAAAPPETFAGALSLGFCPDLEIASEPCQMRGLKAVRKSKGVGYDLLPFPGLRVPWMVLQGEVDQVCSPSTTRAFVGGTGTARVFSLPNVGHGFGVPRNWEPQYVEAYRAIVNARTARDEPRVSAPEVQDLPLVEVPATAVTGRREMAIIVSGDGGWAELDKSVAAGLAAQGIPTVGLSSLRYFWTPRTPEAAAADLARIITHYSAAWRVERVILVGYSFGADVLPFLVNRLDAASRAKVAEVALLGFTTTARFEFHVAEWVGQNRGPEYPTVPEVDRLTVPVTCVMGAGEQDSACGELRTPEVRVVTVGTGHHFGGEYARLVDAILRER
jgi:type IV secretory pathway VirJ component